MRIAFECIFILLSSVSLVLCGYKIFQIEQLSGYKTKPLLVWFKKTRYDFVVRYFSVSFLSFVSMFIFILCFNKLGYGIYILGSIFYIFFSAVFILNVKKEPKKTPLKFTPRIIRCMILTFVLAVGVNLGLIKLGAITIADYSFVAIGLFLTPLVVVLAHLIMSPFEKLNNNRYVKQAIKKLESMNSLIKIGITGSFGKTSAKNILAKMLSKKYKVAFSPSSFNTPMGLSRFINNELRDDDEVLIAEMGARNKGDIAELCSFIKPSHGLVTSIGAQHLETFGSVENIVKTKYELVDGIDINGTMFFAAGSDEILRMYEMCPKNKYMTGEDFSGLELNISGTAFELNIDKNIIKIQTRLLGKHVASLIALCAKCAYSLGVSVEQIREACLELEPVPHRLELIDKGDTVIIDDAYNSNPQGAKNALEILSKFDGTRIIITPGFVEMGESEKNANKELGANIASSVDLAYLIGTRANDIKSGAVKKGMKEESIFIFNTLDEAMIQLKTVNDKKAVLFENDLPDSLS